MAAASRKKEAPAKGRGLETNKSQGRRRRRFRATGGYGTTSPCRLMSSLRRDGLTDDTNQNIDDNQDDEAATRTDDMAAMP
jgi:hypothetical protein